MRVAIFLLVAILSRACNLAFGAPSDTLPTTTINFVSPSDHSDTRAVILAALPRPQAVDRFPPLPTSLPYDYRVWTLSVRTNLTLVVWQMMLYPTTMQDILLNIINAQNALFRGAVAHGFNATIPQDGLEWAFGGCWLQLNNKIPKRLTYVAAADVLFGIKDFMRRFGVWSIAFDVKDDYMGTVGRGYYGP